MIHFAPVQLQTELMDRLKSNEEAYNQAQNLEKLFKTVKMEYDATVPIVKEFQQKAAAAAYGQ